MVNFLGPQSNHLRISQAHILLPPTQEKNTLSLILCAMCLPRIWIGEMCFFSDSLSFLPPAPVLPHPLLYSVAFLSLPSLIHGLVPTTTPTHPFVSSPFSFFLPFALWPPPGWSKSWDIPFDNIFHHHHSSITPRAFSAHMHIAQLIYCAGSNASVQCCCCWASTICSCSVFICVCH